MKVLGIDPGLKTTGYGLVEFQKSLRLLEVGTIDSKAKDPIQQRLKTIYTLLGELVSQHRPDALILEKLYSHSKHPFTASILGHVRGVICLLCAERNIELIEESPKRIRQVITGNGNASKLQTQRVVAHVLNINAEKLTLDASDALALAIGYIDLNRRKV